MKITCKDCTRRSPGCHDHCPEYQEYRKQQMASYEERAKANEKNNAFFDAYLKRYRRYAK